MAYVKQTWANGPTGATPISAARLNHMEDGIENPVDSIPIGIYVDPARFYVRSSGDDANPGDVPGSPLQTLAAAVTAAGAAQATVVVSDAIAVPATTTIPATVRLEFIDEGKLVPAAGVTVTINGSVRPAMRQLFDITDGGVVFGTAPYISAAFPEWWGDSPAAMQACLSAMEPSNGSVFLRSKSYDLETTGVTIDGPLTLYGWGASTSNVPSGPRFLYSGVDAALTVNGGGGEITHGVRLDNLVLDGQGVGAYGLRLGDTGSPSAASVKATNCVATGFTVAGGWLVSSQISDFDHCYFADNPGDGLIADDQVSNTATTFQGCRFKANRRGAWLKSANQFSFPDSIFESNREEGLVVERTSAAVTIQTLSIAGARFESNNTDRSGAGVFQCVIKGFDASNLVLGVNLTGGTFSNAGTGNGHISVKWATVTAEFPTFVVPNDSFGELRGGSETQLFWRTRAFPTISVDTAVGLLVLRQSANSLLTYHNVSGTVTRILSISGSATDSSVPFIAPVGGLTTPAFTYTGDTDTGMYRAGVDRQRMVCGGNAIVDAWLNGGVRQVGFLGATPVARPTALTAADASTVDATYGAEEAAVVGNLRTRLNELETKLQALGLLS